MIDPLETHLCHIRARGMANRTIQSRREWLRWLDRHLPAGLLGATTADIEILLGREGWAIRTRAVHWAHTVMFYRWALRTGHLDRDPTTDLIRPRVPKGLPRPVTDDQVRHALAQLRPPFRLPVLLAAAEGMRCSEIAYAKREDFTADQVTITGKGGRVRSVPTDPRVWAAIEPMPLGLLIAYHGTQERGHWLSLEASKALTAVGLPDATLHRFRHWFGTAAQRGYHDLQATQQLLGHASPNTTVGYAELTDGHRRLAMQTVSAALTNVLEDAA